MTNPKPTDARSSPTSAEEKPKPASGVVVTPHSGSDSSMNVRIKQNAA